MLRNAFIAINLDTLSKIVESEQLLKRKKQAKKHGSKSNKLFVVALLIKQESTSTWYANLEAIQHMCHKSNAFTN